MPSQDGGVRGSIISLEETMRRSSLLAVSTLVLMSGAALFAAEPQTKKQGTPQPVAVVAATGSNLQGRLLTTSNNIVAESPLVEAARSAMAARARNTGNRIVIDSSTLAVSRYHSAMETAAAPAVQQGRSWATASINGDARNAQEQSDKQRQAMTEQARQYQLKIEQSYMGQQHNEVYTETDEDHVTQRLNTIPVEMAQPPQPARPPM
jgi:hypothetical protein